MSDQWRLTTGDGSALLYRGDVHAGKLSSVFKNEICTTLNESESLRTDFERIKTQLRLCEEHAGTMARDFDQSLAVVQDERNGLRAKLAAIQRECEQVVFRKDPMAETRGTFARRLLEIIEGRGE